MKTMGKVDTSDLTMIIKRVIDISFQSPILKWVIEIYIPIYCNENKR